MAEMDTPVPATDTPAPATGVDTGVVDFDSSAISEAYKDTPAGKYANGGELAKGYNEATKLIGAKGVILPGEKATPEEFDKFYTSLGRPEKADGYKFSEVEGTHPDLATPEFQSGFKSLLHSEGISQKQADGLYKKYVDLDTKARMKREEQSNASKHEAETALRTDWGPDYDNNLNSAKRVIEKFGGASAREAFGDLGNNPKVLKTLANIGKQFSEDGFIKGNAIKTAETSDAQKAITDIQLNKEHPYWKEGAGHAEAVVEMKRLHSIVYPEVEF